MTKAEYLALRREEFPKTLKLLRMYPEDKRDLKPRQSSAARLRP